MQGVTLIELLVVIAIAGILAVLAAFLFQETIVGNRMAAQSNKFLSALNFARSEAIEGGNSITLCRSNNGSTCAASGGWEMGWLAFSDTNGNTSLNTGETIVRVWPALSTDFSLRAGSGIAGSIRYDARALVVTATRPRVTYTGDKTAVNNAGSIYTSCTP
ncbi:MAG: type fimbrial biosis protein FimT [Pseudomonadota bacterium]|jgi:type IV fimbrial biogenesis protein FimT